MTKNFKARAPWRSAAPSWVIPGTPAENRAYLGDRYADIGLYFLEAAGSLAYTPAELPPGGDGTAYHVHLPLDLPWADGPRAAFAVAARLADMIAHLSPWGFVLHPPRRPGHLAAFVDLWAASGRDPADILLENVADAGQEALWPVARELGTGLCLDVGHMLAFGQTSLLSTPGVFARTRLAHVYAPYDPDNPRDAARWRLPEREHRHRALSRLDEEGRRALKALLTGLAPEAVVMHEVFDDAALTDSVGIFAALCRAWGFCPCSG